MAKCVVTLSCDSNLALAAIKRLTLSSERLGPDAVWQAIERIEPLFTVEASMQWQDSAVALVVRPSGDLSLAIEFLEAAHGL